MLTNKRTKVAVAVIGILSTMVVPQAFAENNDKKIEKDEIEIITVTGVRGSIQQSMNDKRFSDEIMDGISAEDIGQLPDENIAEALQRVTGIQMTRGANGEGSTIQIRGISDNNVEINGQTASGTGADRSVNFQDLPSELFSGIEVLKASTADRIEGSLGGTVNLKTRRPLGIQEDGVLSVTAKAKYSELAEETTPDFSVFGAKNWRDTSIGDFGFLATVARKETISLNEAFGGGDYDDAPANWFKKNFLKENGKPGAGPVLNRDGTPADITDPNIADLAYYSPAGFRTYSRTDEVVRDSLNATLQWQPNDSMNLFFDATITDGKEDSSGSQFNANINQAGRGVADYTQDNTFESVGSTGSGQEYFYHSSGRVKGTNLRLGGAPSIKETWRDSEKFTFGGDIQITDDLNVAAEYSTSEGTSKTKQAQLNMGYDWDRNGQLNAKDWAGQIDFDLRDVDLVDYTYLEAGSLTPIDPTDTTYDRLSYFQMQRNADDTKSDDESFKIDATLDLDGNFFTKVKVGVRSAERTFSKASYINSNQKNNWKTAPEDTINVDEDGNPLNQTMFMQRLSFDPASNVDALFPGTDMTREEVAQRLQDDCMATASVDLSGQSGNLPREWATTDCGSDYFTELFGMADIRAINPKVGKGYYERAGARYKVLEETKAAYIRADFHTEVFDLPLYGNLGVRYIETDTTSSGYKKTGAMFEWVDIKGSYDDLLPSLNLNLALNEEIIVRFAYADVIQRPGLSAISPSLTLFNFGDEDESEYTGHGFAGNPDLDPIRATNYDLSFEWYYSDSSMFSAALFYKDIESTIGQPPSGERSVIEVEGADENGDPITETYIVSQKQNLEGTSIEGIELNLTHTFDTLPGLLSHTGFSANYTYTNEDAQMMDETGDAIGRKGLSEDSANLVAFYDDGDLSVRLAYNWRSKFVKRQTVLLGWQAENALPEYEKSRGQLDLSANYKINEHLKINFSAINLNDSVTERYLKHEEMTNYYATPGRRYNLGLVYRF